MIKEEMNLIIGTDNTHVEVVYGAEMEVLDSHLIVDYGYIGSVALLIVVVFCVFKMIGGAFKR